MEKTELFEKAKPSKALAVMAAPTIASQMIILIYNLADTWFIGRTGDPYMIAASSLALTIYLEATAIANIFGVGGGSLMIRLIGQKKEDEAKRVASYSISAAFIAALVFSLLVLIFAEPILRLLGASDNTLSYAKQYVMTTTVIGGIPTVLSMCMPQLLRNAGYSELAGIGVGIGSLLNVLLDPLFMFVLLPEGKELLGAGIATMLSNFISLAFFIIVFRRLRDKTVLVLPKKHERIGSSSRSSLYSVGLPAAFAIVLFDLVTIVINRLTVAYGDIPLAAMGIVLKIERIPINIGLGVCLGMVPLLAYNFGSGDLKRMSRICSVARTSIIIFATACAVLFWLFADSFIGVFISDTETVTQGADFLRGRCFLLPFMMLGYHIVNYMNAVNKGKVSFLLALIRHVVLIIPIMIIMDKLWGITGLTWSQLAADVINAAVALAVFIQIDRRIKAQHAENETGQAD